MSTLDEVATLAGVSKSTVCRVIHQRGYVHPDTVRVVRAALDHTRYQPPSLKAGKMSRADATAGPSRSLCAYALVVPQIAGGLYLSLLSGFEAAAHERYRQSFVCNTQNNVYRQSHELLQLIQKRVSGVAIVPVAEVPTPPAHIQALQSAGIPVVLLHRDVEGVNCPLVALPLEQVGYDAGQAIVAHGHRRVALVTVAQGPSSAPHRRGLQRAMEQAGLALPEELIQICTSMASGPSPDTEASVAAALDRLWALPTERRPTAIYATNDLIAETLYLQLLSRNCRVPHDVSIVGFGSRERLGAVAGRLTSVVVDEMSVGRLAVEFLERVAADRGAGFGTERLTQDVPIGLFDGTTLGPPRE